MVTIFPILENKIFHNIPVYITPFLAEIHPHFDKTPPVQPNPKTFAGLAGVGDLIATCGSPLSRNYTFGSNLGKGLSVEEATKVSNGVAEGVPTTDAVVALGKQYGVPTPLATAMSHVLDDGISCAQMLSELFGEGITEE